MEANLSDITEVETDSRYKALLVKEAEKSTEEMHKVFKQLNAWWLNYKMILQYIFKDDQQELEAFKIKAYSGGYKPKKKEKEEKPGDEPQEEPTDTEKTPVKVETREKDNVAIIYVDN